MSCMTKLDTRARGILMSGPMVRATLDGRKTETRRVCRVQPFKLDGLWHAFYPWGDGGHGIYDTEEEMREEFTRLLLRRCPYGQPGDRLWVRETWRIGDGMNPEGDEKKPTYAADWPDAREFVKPWRPSIHMPRWASRITLELVEVRVERVQEITEEDARAEGCPEGFRHPIDWFSQLWDSLNDARGFGWVVDPWVWVLRFRRVVP